MLHTLDQADKLAVVSLVLYHKAKQYGTDVLRLVFSALSVTRLHVGPKTHIFTVCKTQAADKKVSCKWNIIQKATKQQHVSSTTTWVIPVLQIQQDINMNSVCVRQVCPWLWSMTSSTRVCLGLTELWAAWLLEDSSSPSTGGSTSWPSPVVTQKHTPLLFVYDDTVKDFYLCKILTF